MKRFFPVVLSVAAPAAFAADDLSSLTSQIDFSGVGTAIMAVAAALAGIYVLYKGAKIVIGALKGM